MKTVSDVQEALEFSQWLSHHRDRDAAFGIAAQDGVLGIATQEDGWWLNTPSPEIDVILGSSISLLLNPANGVTFSCFAMNDLISSRHIPQSKYAVLCSKVENEVEALSYCTGRRFARGYRNPVDEAYDAQQACEHLAKDGEVRSLEFYRKVALPAIRHRMRFMESGEGDPWHISYEDLFLRVLAHQSREPVLVRAFLDGRDPVEACQERLEIEDPGVCYAVVLWASFKFDTAWFRNNYPEVHALLPEDLNAAMKKVEERLPIIVLWTGQVMNDFTRQKAVRSLYGRVFRWNASVADACHFSLVGSVQDVLDVVLVSMLNNPEGAWVDPDPVSDDFPGRVFRLSGRAGKATRQSWVPVARILGEAGNPLSIPLGSTVVWS